MYVLKMTDNFVTSAINFACVFLIFASTTALKAQSPDLSPPQEVKLNFSNDTSLEFIWNPPEGYKNSEDVEYKGFLREKLSDTEFNMIWTGECRKIFGGLKSNTEFEFELSAHVGSQTSGAVKVYASTSANQELKPPENLTLVEVTSTSLTLRWDSADDATQQALYFYILTDEKLEKVSDGSTSETFASLEDLTPYTEYKFKVFAVDGSSALHSRTVEYNEPILTLVDKPSHIRSFQPSTWISTAITLRWAVPAFPNGPIDRYELETYKFASDEFSWETDPFRKDDIQGEDELISFTVENLKPASNYKFKIRAVNVLDGESLKSDPFYTTWYTDNSYPGPCEAVKVSDITETSFALAWNPPKVLNGTKTAYKVLLTNGSVEHAIRAKQSPLLIEDLSPDTVYNVSLYAYNLRRNLLSGPNVTFDGPRTLITVTTDFPKPSAPENITFVGVHEDNIVVDFVASQNSDSCTATAVDAFVGRFDEVLCETSLTSANCTNLEPYTEYYVEIFCDRGLKEGLPAKSDLIMTLESAPSPPQELTVTTAANTMVSLKWKLPKYRRGPIDFFEVYVNGSKHSMVAGHKRACSVEGLQPRQSYVISVLAVNKRETMEDETEYLRGDVSSVVAYTTDNELDIPANITVSGITEDSAIVFWNVPAENETVGGCEAVAWSLLGAEHNVECSVYDSDSARCMNLTDKSGYSVHVRCYVILRDNRPVWSDEGVSKVFFTINYVPDPVTELSLTPFESRSLILEMKTPDSLIGAFHQYNFLLCEIGDNYCPGQQEKNDTNGPCNEHKTDDTVYVFRNLKVWTRYALRIVVSAIVNDDNGAERFSPETALIGRTPMIEPSKVTQLKVSAIDHQSLNVTWNPPEKQNGPLFEYEIHILSKNGKRVSILNTTGTTTVAEGLEPYTEYDAVVWATNGCDESMSYEGQSEIASGTTDVFNPEAPVLIQTTDVKDVSIAISWDPPVVKNGPIDGYIVQCGDLSGEVEGTSTKQLLEDLKSFTEYQISVTAFNVGNNGAILVGPSANISVRTDCGAPGAVEELYVELLDETSAIISWTPPKEPNGNIDGYSISVCVDSTNGTCLVEEDISSTRLSHKVSDMVPYEAYNITVKAFNINRINEKFFGPSEIKQVHTPVSEPGEVQGLDAVEISSTSVNLTWAPPKKPNGPINYYLLTIKLRTGEQFSQEMVKTTYKTVQNLDPYTQYSFYVRAVNVDQNKKLLGAESFYAVRTRPTKPLAVEKIFFDCQAGKNTIVLNWTPSRILTGKLESFSIHATGIKYATGTEVTKEYSIPVVNCNTVNKVLECSATLTQLPAEHNYRFYIAAKNEEVEELGDITAGNSDCFLQSGDPPTPQKSVQVDYSEQVLFCDKSSEHIIAFEKDMFSDFNGDIVRYELLVGPPGFQPDYNASYIATPKNWNPFKLNSYDTLRCQIQNKTSVTAICTLGLNKECKTMFYCNMALQPLSSYSVAIKGYTQNGYAYSPVSQPFSTSEAYQPHNIPAEVYAGASIGVLLVLAIGVAGAIFYRRRVRFEEETEQLWDSSAENETEESKDEDL